MYKFLYTFYCSFPNSELARRDFLESDLSLQITENDYRDYRATFILNEKAVREIGSTSEEAVGKTIQRGALGTVVGIVRDFQFESLHEHIGPLLIFLDKSSIRQMFVKIDAQRTSETLKALDEAWSARIGHRPFDYHFMDEDFTALYQSEQRIAGLFSLFAGIAAILIALVSVGYHVIRAALANPVETLRDE